MTSVIISNVNQICEIRANISPTFHYVERLQEIDRSFVSITKPLSNKTAETVENPEASRDFNIFLIGCIIICHVFPFIVCFFEMTRFIRFLLSAEKEFFFLQIYFLVKSQNFTETFCERFK